MAVNLPYLPSYKNVGVLFDKIMNAGKPDVFTHRFLYDIIGLKGTGDRALIPLLKTMGFLDAGNKPTSSYSELKNKQLAKKAIGKALRIAYAPLFAANEAAHALDLEGVKGLIAQVAGTDEAMTNKIAWTFNALAKAGDFSAPTGSSDAVDRPKPEFVIRDQRQGRGAQKES